MEAISQSTSIIHADRLRVRRQEATKNRCSELDTRDSNVHWYLHETRGMAWSNAHDHGGLASVLITRSAGPKAFLTPFGPSVQSAMSAREHCTPHTGCCSFCEDGGKSPRGLRNKLSPHYISLLGIWWGGANRGTVENAPSHEEAAILLLLLLQRKERHLIVTRDNLPSGLPFQLLQTTGASEPRRMVTSEPALRDTIAPLWR